MAGPEVLPLLGDHVEHRRNEKRKRAALPQFIEGHCRGEVLHDADSGAYGQGGQREAGIGKVKHGPRDQHHVVRRQPELPAPPVVVHGVVVVGIDGPFGETGGPRRIADDAGLGTDFPLTQRRPRRYRRRLYLVHGQHGDAQRLRGGRRRTHIAPAGQHQAAIGTGQHVLRLGAGQPAIDRHGYDPGPLAGGERQRGIGAVRQQQPRHPAVTAGRATGSGCGERRDSLPHLPVRHPLTAAHGLHRHAVGMGETAGGYAVGDAEVHIGASSLDLLIARQVHKRVKFAGDDRTLAGPGAAPLDCCFRDR